MRELYTLIHQHKGFSKGWLPVGANHSNLNPNSTGFMVAHDLIEHQNGSEALGSIIDEMEAFGAIWAIRGASSYLFDRKVCDDEIVQYYVNNFRYLMNQFVKNTKELPSLTCLEDKPFLDGVVAESFKVLHNEEWWDDAHYPEHRVEWFEHCAKFYMQKGHAKCLRRFGSADVAHSLFFALEYELDKVMPDNHGCNITVSIEDFVPTVTVGDPSPHPKPSFFEVSPYNSGFQKGS